MVKYLPGFIAAVLAYVILRLVSLADTTFWVQTLVFFAVYVVGAISFEIAMKNYRGSSRK